MCLPCTAGGLPECPWTTGYQFEMGGPLKLGSTRRRVGRKKKVRRNTMGKYLSMLAEYGQLYKWVQWVQYKKEERFRVKKMWEFYQHGIQEDSQEDWENIPGFPGWPRSAVSGNEYFEE